MVGRLVYITTSNAEEAERIGREIVEMRLAACANILSPMHSIFWWEGRVNNATEAVLLLKTTEAHVDAVIETARQLHSYDCPAIVALPIVAGNPAFLEWIENETR